jgi:ribosome-binding factor A
MNNLKEVSNRRLKVAEQIKYALTQVIARGRIDDSRIQNSSVTITRVTVTPDLRIANCYFMPFLNNISHSELLDAFDVSKNQIRHLITLAVKLKYSPELRFFYDDGMDNLYKVESVLRNIT